MTDYEKDHRKRLYKEAQSFLDNIISCAAIIEEMIDDLELETLTTIDAFNELRYSANACDSHLCELLDYEEREELFG